ncbi:hypothetical protein BJV74DRAFT_954505 [Russula compacta]|nr:hypothetical protein BJV74DRAFT_954505 [Russula compacta]
MFKRPINVYRADPMPLQFQSRCIRRDGYACVISQATGEFCDAAHLIPRSKGDEVNLLSVHIILDDVVFQYIAKVIQLRSPRDNLALPGIGDIINGMLLRKDLHVALGMGQVDFIKTPNYGLRPEHIRRFQRGGPRPDYITLHWLKKPGKYDPTTLAALQTLQTGGVHPNLALGTGANVDALFQGEGGSLPSTVILGYVYGVAAYNPVVATVVTFNGDYDCRKTHYANIPPLPPAPPDDADDADDTSGPDYPTTQNIYTASHGNPPGGGMRVICRKPLA